MEKSMTTDDLARLIQGEFQNVHAEFQNVHAEFQNVHSEINELKSDITELRSDMDELHEKVDVLDTKVNRIDFRTQNQVDAVYEDATILKKDMKQAKGDIVAIKAHIGLPA